MSSAAHKTAALETAAPNTAATVPPLRHRSVFWEILKWVVIPLLFALPLSWWATYRIGISLATDAFDRGLASQTKALAEQLVWMPLAARYQLMSDLPTVLPDDEIDTHLFRIEDGNGQLLLGDAELAAAPREDITEFGAVYFRDEIVGTLKVRSATVMRTIADTDTPVYVQVAETTEKRTVLAREIARTVFLPQAILIPATVLLLWWGLRRGLAPLNRLRRQITARAITDVSPVSTIAAPEEVVPLLDAFNQVLTRAAQYNDTQRRFIANAAHQLRTPLAGVRMQTQLALQSHDRETMVDALQRIASGSARSTHLVNQLLALARAEAGAATPLAMVIFDLSALTRTTVEEAWPNAHERGFDLGVEVPNSPIMCKGNAPLLREMLSNLIDNALKYSPSNGAVTVRLTRPEGVLVLEVEDAGVGIAAVERELVFERFYRSQGTAPDQEGTGIGLAIVKEIVTQHGGSVRVETPASGTGTLMRLTLPLGVKT